MRIEHVGFAPSTVDYLDGWQRQREVHAAVVAREVDDTIVGRHVDLDLRMALAKAGEPRDYPQRRERDRRR